MAADRTQVSHCTYLDRREQHRWQAKAALHGNTQIVTFAPTAGIRNYKSTHVYYKVSR
jgi:hypothetical protein